MLKLLNKFEYLFNETLCIPEKDSVDLGLKEGFEANMFATISSTEGTWINGQKGGWKFSPTSIPWGREWFRMMRPILHKT